MYIVRYEKNLKDKYGDKVDALARPYPFLPFVLIKIDVAKEDRESLLVHEKEHWKQHLMTLTLHPLLYNYFDWYRLWAEIRAHKRELEISADKEADATRYALSIANKYGIKGVRPIDVYRRLMKGVEV
jgi:hypothetical protein